jgi:hypothetical protein
MKKQILLISFFSILFFSCFSQIRKATTKDNIRDYLSEILKVNVSFYLLNGYGTEKKDSLRYELLMICTFDTAKNVSTYYCNEDLDRLFEINNLNYPILIPLKDVSTQETSLINLSKRTHRRNKCYFE